jgi:hypothetical protein
MKRDAAAAVRRDKAAMFQFTSFWGAIVCSRGSLGTVSTLENLVTFYVDEHNTQLPHSAFRGQTPDEMYFGTGNDIPAELEAARITARQSRIEANRSMSCKTCEPLTSIAG